MRYRKCLYEIFNNDVRHLIGSRGEVTTLLRNRMTQKKIGMREGIEEFAILGLERRGDLPIRKSQTLQNGLVSDLRLIVLHNSH
jgi:hypothetical protein